MSKQRRTLLIIDDDDLFRDSIKDHLDDNGITVWTSASGEAGLRLCAQKKIDVVLLDQELPDARGDELCREILDLNDRTKIIFITAYPSFEHAVKAIKSGAHDYLSKPFELEELDLALKHAYRTLGLEKVAQLQQYKNRVESEDTVLIGEHGGLFHVSRLIQLALENQAPVLITGETGTGKSVIAKTIHYRGHDAKAPFIGINCAALPEHLMEAELFGYEKGAFTGALKSRKGIFEMAEGGTLFLDEIGEMPLHLQSKLLGVLDDKKIKKIGGQSLQPVDTRIIAATNADLETAVENNLFRKDLFFRLSVIRIEIPPLRERPEDIEALCAHFIQKMYPDQEVRISELELANLRRYVWPGNVRELRNVMERALLLCRNSVLEPSRLLDTSTKLLPPKTIPLFAQGDDVKSLKDVERSYIRYALSKLDHNHSQTAQKLGISRSTLLRKMKVYGIVDK